MVWIPGGTFAMGSNDFYPEEAPVHDASVSGYWIDIYEVTNAEYARFVEETGYVTVAERLPDPQLYPGARSEDLVPGSLVFRRTQGPVDLNDYRQWWEWMPGAQWRHPLGPHSTLAGLDTHPVVHIAYEDADAYAAWAGKSLPTEAEWEYAARGGLSQKIFAWGDEMQPDGTVMANTWQGEFPWRTAKSDGYRTTPVGSFPANGYGLYDMAGNVWEWTSDWYVTHAEAIAAGACCAVSRQSITAHHSVDPAVVVKIPRKVIKGGSHLCAPNYCLRFRPAARSPETIETGTSHLGFRCVKRP
ncbi:MAG: formylglycine-generating enzyme family protein [Candidatus Eremiobacteraeota bacterium]|nr:formylglycine-generating enzyme family protein [Candidatus Eremiobacteraeota bacterium]